MKKATGKITAPVLMDLTNAVYDEFDEDEIIDSVFKCELIREGKLIKTKEIESPIVPIAFHEIVKNAVNLLSNEWLLVSVKVFGFDWEKLGSTVLKIDSNFNYSFNNNKGK